MKKNDNVMIPKNLNNLCVCNYKDIFCSFLNKIILSIS